MKKPFQPDLIFQPDPDFLVEPIDSDVVLYHSDTEKVIYLNSSAATFWHLCDGKRSFAKCIDIIESAYPDATTVTRDLQDAAKNLLDIGALSISSKQKNEA